ncbi:MAG TPA: hypothetical protein VJA26_11380, partial [Gammaproteobacteria bacterium]|nr:hypothetical protein [Gammaproteobacteria bacterium]
MSFERPDRFEDARCARRLTHGPLHRAFMNMMSSVYAAPRIARRPFGWKFVLPTPVEHGAKIFAGQGVRQLNASCVA